MNSDDRKAKKIANYLHKEYGRWGWMGQRAHDAAGINNVLPLDFIVSCDHGTDIPQYFREKDVFSVEKYHKIRKDWSNEDLNAGLEGSMGHKVFDRWNKYGERVNLLCYRSIRRIENGPRELTHTPKMYAVPEKLKRYFDDKVLLYRNLPKFSLHRIPGKTGKLGDNTFISLRKELSVPFVVQFPRGSSGHFTFIIREEKEYNKLRRGYPSSTVVMRKYVDGFSVNVNAVIVSRNDIPETFCSFPSVQIAGVPECSNFSSAFCGNDFTTAGCLSPVIIRQVEENIKKIGKWMARKDYRGIFGMDFIVENETVYAVEINPRFQNSTSLYTVLGNMAEGRAGELFLLHIAEFMRDSDAVMKEYLRGFPYPDLMRPLKGAQIILHNRMAKNIVAGKLLPGVYRSGNDEIKFLRESARLDACRRQNEFIVTCGVPGAYVKVEPNAPVCKIQMLNGVLNLENKCELSGKAKKIVANVYKKLELKAADKVEMAGTV